MSCSIFVNYRTSDSAHAAIAIAETLRWAFEDKQVFLDRKSINGGKLWPKSIKTALESAKVLVVIIGDKWLLASDQYGRRRIDHPDDWVRREILRALERDIPIVPVLLENAGLPPIEALDDSLHGICDFQAERVRTDSWDSDIGRLIQTLTRLSNIPLRLSAAFPNGIPIPRPKPLQQGQPILAADEIEAAISRLDNWTVESNYHPWAVGGLAVELVRVLEFSTFSSAVDFISYAAKEMLSWSPQHHPRWENQWRSVRICFTTWDVGCNLTQLDVDAAHRTDELFMNFKK